MKTFKELLIELNACEEAVKWAGDKSWPEVYQTCHRGDWLAWLFKKTNPKDKRKIVLLGGHFANTVRDLMKDERSTNCVDLCIRYGEGNATDEELPAASAAALSAAWAAADAARAAAWAAADAAWAAADAAWAAADAAWAAADAAWVANQKQTSDIFRSLIKISDFNINL